MRIFITGAGGFIGSCISNYLSYKGHEIIEHNRSKNGDLSPDGIPDNSEVIVNSAGRLGSPNVNTSELTQSNAVLPEMLADFCTKKSIHLIHLSTPGVSGLLANASEDLEYNPWGEYELSKMKGEISLREHDSLPSHLLTVLRPDFVYGPGDMHKLELFKQVQKGWFPLIGFNGARIRPTYCADVCRAVNASLPGGCLNGGLYNIGGPEVLKFRDFILKTALSMGIKLKILPVPRLFFFLALKLGPLCPRALSESKYKLFGTDHFVSISRAEKAGFYPEYDVKKGVDKTGSWYRENRILPG